MIAILRSRNGVFHFSPRGRSPSQGYRGRDSSEQRTQQACVELLGPLDSPGPSSLRTNSGSVHVLQRHRRTITSRNRFHHYNQLLPGRADGKHPHRRAHTSHKIIPKSNDRETHNSKTTVFYTIPRLDVSGRFPCENVYRNPCIYQCIETSIAGWVSSHRATMIDERFQWKYNGSTI